MTQHAHLRNTVILLIILLFTLPALAQDATAEPAAPSPVTSMSDPVAEAQALVDEAQAQHQLTLENINHYLGFIQGGAILLGLLSAVLTFVGTAIGGLNIFRLNQQLHRVQTETQKYGVFKAELEQKQNELKSGAEELGRRIQEVNRIREDLNLLLKENNQRTENAMRALALSQLAARQVELGNMKAARNILDEACKLEEGNHVLNYFAGDLYLRSGDVENGMKFLDKARKNGDFLAADASYAYALRLRGDREHNSQLRDEYYKRAESLFKHVAALDEDLLDISGESAFGALAGLYRRQAEQYLSSSEDEKAQTCLDSAFVWYEHCDRITPQNSYPVNNLGLLHYRYSGKHPKANKDAAQGYFEKSRNKAIHALAFSTVNVPLNSNRRVWMWISCSMGCANWRGRIIRHRISRM